MANNKEQYQQSSKTNPGSGTTAGSATASCPPQACEVSTFSVECAHNKKGRNYILDVINSKPNHNNTQKVLQVIAKPGDPDEIEVSFKGGCAHDSKDCPSVKVTGGDEDMQGTGISYKFKVLPKPVDKKPLTFINFLSKYLIPDEDALFPTTYTIQNHKCSGAGLHKAIVEVFPTYGWDGSLTFGFFQPGQNPDEAQKKTLDNKNETGHWGLQGKLGLNIGTQNWSFAADTKQKKTSEVDDYFPTLKKMVGGLVKTLEEVASFAKIGQPLLVDAEGKEKKLVNIDVTWPKVTIGGKVDLQESPKNYNVDLGGELTLGFDPFIKASVSTDLIDWFIALGKKKGYGEFLEMIRNKAEKRGFIVRLMLSVEGELKSQLSWKKNADETWLSKEGTVANELSAGVTIGIMGEIKVDTDIFFVKVTMGAELHIKGARNANEGIGVFFNMVATTDKSKPALGGSIVFTGAAIYYTYYAEVGKNETDTNKTGDQPGGRIPTRKNSSLTNQKITESSAKLKKDKLEELVKIFDYCEWPNPVKEVGQSPATELNNVKL